MTTPSNSGDSIEGVVRDLAAQITAAAQPAYTAPQVVKGTITAFSSDTTPPTVSLNLSGDTTAIDGVRYLISYSPLVGDVVALLKTGPDLFVLGAYAQGASSWTTPTLSSGFAQNGDSQGNVQYRLVWDNGSPKMQWQGAASRTANTTIIAASQITSTFRPTAKRKVPAARGMGNGNALPNCQLVFNTDGTVVIDGHSYGIAMGTSATENAQHDHYSYNPEDGLSYFTNTENEQHAHALGNLTIPAADWVSFHNVEYFL